MILDKDAFTVEYDAALTSLEDMYAAISALGYTPRLAPLDVIATESPAVLDESTNPVLPALALAQAAGKMVFVDFYAPWCIACKALEQQTLSTDQVQAALDNFIVVNVDTDLYPAAAVFYQVVGMPTLLVLDGDGVEVYRSVGTVSAAALAQGLNDLSNASSIHGDAQSVIQH